MGERVRAESDGSRVRDPCRQRHFSPLFLLCPTTLLLGYAPLDEHPNPHPPSPSPQRLDARATAGVSAASGLAWQCGGGSGASGGGSRATQLYVDDDGRLWLSQNDCLTEASNDFITFSVETGATFFGGIGATGGPLGSFAMSGIGAYLGFLFGLSGASTYAGAQCPP